MLLEAFTDGGCTPSKGQGKKRKASAAFILVNRNEILGCQSRLLSHGSPNISEHAAVDMLIDYLISNNHHNDVVHVYTDSQAVFYTYTRWIHQWKSNHWRKSNGKNVENRELIERVHSKLSMINNITFHWIRGHSGNKFNEIVHHLCDITLK